MTIYSLNILLFLFGTSLLFHVQFQLLLPDLHTNFSRGRSGGLVFHLLQNFPVYCDPHNQRFWHSQYNRNRCFFWNTLAFLMIQRMLTIWSLVPLPFLKPAWTFGSSRFMYHWSLAWRILSITLLACEMSTIVSSLSILWHCLSLGLEWKLTFSSPVATAEFSKFADILSEALLTALYLLGYEIAQLEFHHLY